MMIAYRVVQWDSDTGVAVVEAKCEAHPLPEKYTLALLNGDGTLKFRNEEELRALIEASIPVAAFEMKIARAAASPDDSAVITILNSGWKAVERSARDQGVLKVSVL